MEQKKLFLVEFGEPQVSTLSFSFSSNLQSPLYVVAHDYNEAAEKALSYIEYKRTLDQPKNSILTSDGSLIPNIEEELAKIRAIRLASEEVVW